MRDNDEFVSERRRCATTVKMSHAKLATLNSNNSVVIVRHIKCGYSFPKLEQAENFETEIEQIW